MIDDEPGAAPPNEPGRPAASERMADASAGIAAGQVPADAPPSKARYLVGCWMAVVGYLAGGMIAVAFAKLVGALKGCTPPRDMPACDFETYLRVGTTVGLIGLPAVVVWRMWQSDARRRDSERG